VLSTVEGFIMSVLFGNGSVKSEVVGVKEATPLFHWIMNDHLSVYMTFDL